MAGDYSDWLQFWPHAILMIVIALWVFYHFLAPASWREWAGAGLVQAFIIALYAEMYGFPLTIYVLTSVLPLEIPLVHFSGHLWATLLGYGRIGGFVEMTVGYVLVTVGLILIIRGWVRIYFAAGQMVTTGVYALIRHPQYAGVLLAIVGQIVHWPTIPTLALAPFIVIAYVHLARREEARLVDQFGASYVEYRRNVSMFIPHWRRLRQRTAALRGTGG